MGGGGVPPGRRVTSSPSHRAIKVSHNVWRVQLIEHSHQLSDAICVFKRAVVADGRQVDALSGAVARPVEHSQRGAESHPRVIVIHEGVETLDSQQLRA